MNYKIIYSVANILFVFLFISCVNKKNDISRQYKCFFDVDSVIDVSTYPLEKPLNSSLLQRIENRLLLFSDYNEVYIYSYPNLKYVGMLQFPYFRSENVIDRRIYLENQGAVNVYKLNDAGDLCENMDLSFRVAVVPFSVGPVYNWKQDLYAYSDMYDLDGMYEFHIVNVNNNDTESKGAYPEDLGRFKSLKDFKLAYAHCMALKPDRSAIVIAYSFMRLIRIYDNKCELKHDVFIDCVPGNYKVVPEKKSDRYYQANRVVTTDDYIFIANPEQHIESIMPHSNILVMDWNGNLIARYRLNVFVKDFFVDSSDNTIWGLCTSGNQTAFFSIIFKKNKEVSIKTILR